MAAKTTTWYVGYIWEGMKPIVLVSAKSFSAYRMRIRTITARAAGRKYIRGNLACSIASADLETDNIFSGRYMIRPTKEEMERLAGRAVKNATIRVIK